MTETGQNHVLTQNRLDATAHERQNRRVMKLHCKKFFSRKAYMPAVCSLLMASLSACGDKEATAEPQPEATAATAATPAAAVSAPDTAQTTTPAPKQAEPADSEKDAADEEISEEEVDTRKQIYDIMVYQVAPAVSAQNSPVSPQIREVLRLLNEQYEQDKEKLAGSPDLTRLAILIAGMRSSFGAWDAALTDFDRALEDYRAMPQETQDSPLHAGWLSAIYKGKAVCYLNKQDQAKALEQFQLRLENDEKRAAAIPELTPGAQINTNVISIARDLLAAMHDKASCVAVTNREEARDLYQQAIEKAQKLILLPDLTIHLHYIQILDTAADNEIKCNNPEKAKEHYTTLMQHCVNIHNSSRDANVKKVMLAYAQAAEKAYKQIEGGQQPHEITTEPINPDLPPLDATLTPPAAEAETTTVSATPEVKAEPEPKEETPKKSKRNRRRR